MKVAVSLCVLILFSSRIFAQGSKYAAYPITPVKINDVQLTDDFWLPRIKTVQLTTIKYGFDKCQEEGRMDNFLIAGGKMKGKTRGKMPFDDTDVYKIIEGASNSLISYPNKHLEAYLDSIISIVRIGQEPDGYLATWHTIDPNHPPATWVKPGPRWLSEISSHELYNAGHLYEAAATHFIATGKRNFLDIALKNADLLVKTFGPEPGQIHAPPGHQIVETGLIKLYNITGNEKYLKLAKYFLDIRGDSTTHRLYGSYNQDSLPVTRQSEVVGHAVRAVYMYAGMTDIAAIYNDTSYLNAVQQLWANMVEKKMYLTGGIGARHEGESFGGNYELPNLTAYNETCASIGDVYWNHRLFMLSGDAKYFDVIERTLYNGLISGLSFSGDRFFYPNPLASDGKYLFNQGSATRAAWFDASCCPTNLIRFIPALPGLMYATQKDSLYVNLYASDKATINLAGKKVSVKQLTNYPWNGRVVITVDPPGVSSFTVKLRIPGWARNEVLPSALYSYQNGSVQKVDVRVNGKPVNYTMENGYAVISRSWKQNDRIELDLPMEVRKVLANANVAEDAGKLALERGPLVYCAEWPDNNGNTSNILIPSNANFKAEFRKDLLNGIVVLKGEVKTRALSNTGPAALQENKLMTAIPYYAWSHRGVGEMTVWFPGL